jgi:hypothetical protein
MLAGRFEASSVEITGDAEGLRELVEALGADAGSFREIRLAREAPPHALLVAVRIKVKGGSAAVCVLRIGDVLHVNGSTERLRLMADAVAAVAAGGPRLDERYAPGHAYLDGVSDAFAVAAR